MNKDTIFQELKMVSEGLLLITKLVARVRKGDSQADQCLEQAQHTVLDLQNNITQIELAII